MTEKNSSGVTAVTTDNTICAALSCMVNLPSAIDTCNDPGRSAGTLVAAQPGTQKRKPPIDGEAS